MQMANTPLHVAAGHNSVEVVKFLLNMAGPETVELEAKNMVCKIFIHSLSDLIIHIIYL